MMITASPTTDERWRVNEIGPHAADMMNRGEKLEIKRKDRMRKETSAMLREYQFVIVAAARHPKATAVNATAVIARVISYGTTKSGRCGINRKSDQIRRALLRQNLNQTSTIAVKEENVRHHLRQVIVAAVKTVAITIATGNLIARATIAAGEGRTTLHVEKK
jgi:hypothetical protein